MKEEKYIPLSELKIGMEIRGYKTGKSNTYCNREVTSIKNDTVSFNRGDSVENASDYCLSKNVRIEACNKIIMALEGKENMKGLVCLIRWYLDKSKLKNKCSASVWITKKNEKHTYFPITFGKKLVQLIDTEYLYTMSLKEFYENYRIIRY